MSKKQSKELFVLVSTYNGSGQEVGSRVVDMYHYGTRNWLSNHLWWAMHQGHDVRQRLATAAEIIELVQPEPTAESVAA